MLFITFVARTIFSSAYMNLENEKIGIIINNIKPSIALNLSYGFDEAISEVSNKTLENTNVLLLKITNYETKGVEVFTNGKLTIPEYLDAGHLTQKVTLSDPATKIEIGELEIIYSKASYEHYMDNFKQWFIGGTISFFFSIMFLAYLLYKSLNKLTILDASLKAFNPNFPRKLNLDISTGDEISSISQSANTMIDNITKFLKHSKELNTKLYQSQAHLKDAQRMAKVGSWDYNVDDNLLVLSDEYYRILGLKQSTPISWDDFLALICEDDYNRVIKEIQNAIKNGSQFELEYAIVLHNAKILHIRSSGKVRKKQNASMKITGISMDITNEIQNKRTIEKLAYFDALTGLANRTLLRDRMHKAIQNAKRAENMLAVIFLDLDHFKLINDTLGHSVGDDLLIFISDLLKKQIREVDTLARLGGDEFVILLPSIKTPDDAHLVASKIQKVLEHKHNIGTHNLYITSSIGVSIYPQHGENSEELIRNADTAMYEAKNGGRNMYKVYSNDMGDFVDKQLHLEQDLTAAIKNKREIEVFYQVKIDAKTKMITGAEALVRWRHPTKGLIYPDSFIYMAESTGLMLELGNIIIQESIMHIRDLNALGFDNIKIAINLSARQFQDSNLVAFVASLLDFYDVNPSQIEFEITESISMSNMISTLKILTELKELGVSIAIDDFGTGHSSLAYLKKFPIDILKIDKSFVMDIIEDEEDRVITQTIINMAHSLGMKTVAEGVETQAHVNMLCNMDCDLLQGYFYSRPIAKDEFVAFIKGYTLDN
jgi:diguanylate cyclase (GGDEF)-like protein